MKTKGYTIVQAVRDALDFIPWNTSFHCYYLFDLVRNNLRDNNNHSMPYDGTIQRVMRRLRHEYNLKCVNHNKSIYMKIK